MCVCVCIKLIFRAKLISYSKIIIYKELKNIKKTLINNGFLNYIVDEKIQRTIEIVSQQNNHCNTSYNKPTFIKKLTLIKCTAIIN